MTNGVFKGLSDFIEETSIPGLLKIKREIFRDERGFFREVFRLSDLQAFGIDFRPIQLNHSLSKKGVIRALHAENWNKLVYPVTGKVFAAIVDVRVDSPTFAKVATFEFDNSSLDADRYALFVPRGLANSICVIGNEDVHYLYLVDAYYDGRDTRAIAWNDPDLAIDWPIKNPIISERDKDNPTLRQLFPDKFK